LLPGSGSNWSAALIVAVFVSAFGLITMAVICRVGLAAAATVPTVHKPFELK